MSDSPTARLFIALWPAAADRRRLAGWQAAFRWPADARLTPVANLHVTVQFIGPVPLARLPEVATGLAMPSPSIELQLGHADVWRGGIAVLEPLSVPEPLLALHARLAEALRALALPVETRPYRPHVTLARRAGVRLPAFEALPPPAHCRFEGHVLVASAGGQYSVLRRYDAG